MILSRDRQKGVPFEHQDLEIFGFPVSLSCFMFSPLAPPMRAAPLLLFEWETHCESIPALRVTLRFEAGGKPSTWLPPGNP